MLAQRGGALALVLVALAAGPWRLGAEALLLAAGQPAAAARGASAFLSAFSPALPAIVGFETVRRFLVAQGVLRPCVIATALGCYGVHPVALRLLAPLRVTGAAAAPATRSGASARSASGCTP